MDFNKIGHLIKFDKQKRIFGQDGHWVFSQI